MSFCAISGNRWVGWQGKYMDSEWSCAGRRSGGSGVLWSGNYKMGACVQSGISHRMILFGFELVYSDDWLSLIVRYYLSNVAARHHKLMSSRALSLVLWSRGDVFKSFILWVFKPIDDIVRVHVPSVICAALGWPEAYSNTAMTRLAWIKEVDAQRGAWALANKIWTVTYIFFNKAGFCWMLPLADGFQARRHKASIL